MRTKTSTLSIFFAFILLLVLILTRQAHLSSAAPAADGTVYLPLVFKPQPPVSVSVDLTVGALEVTQSVQTTSNSVPLVARRPTVVRVFAQASDDIASSDVTVSLTARRNGTMLGQVTVGPQAVPMTPERGDYDSTFNATLPATWLSGGVDLAATVDSAEVVPETNENNNTSSLTLNFSDVPPLAITIVPVDYTYTPTGEFYPGQAVDNISDWIMRTYPVSEINVSSRSPYSFSGDLRNGSEWSRLLEEVTALKSADGFDLYSAQVYYALVPIRNSSSQWFYSGIAGIGWIGLRASVGLNLNDSERAGALAGHEIGHNFNRRHAPCGGAGNLDPDYPHDGASIGEYGLDVFNTVLWRPDEAVDMMSYCRPEWVSDYTYTGLYNDQREHGLLLAEADTVPGLLVRATFDGDGRPTLAPVYPFPAMTVAPERVTGSDYGDDGGYLVELVDAGGNVIAAQAVTVLTAEEPGVTARAILAQVPLPETPVAGVRLRQQSMVVAQRQLDAPVASLQMPALARTADGRVRLSWGLPDTPALVRYTADNGQSWTTLALDVLGGELTVDMGTLPGANGRFEVILADAMSPTVLRIELPASN
jgi:hypothetical protein